MKNRRNRAGIFLLLASFIFLTAADWPTYQSDNRRSGVSMEKLALPLHLRWTFRPTNPPEKAWGDPPPGVMDCSTLEYPRNRFDDAYHVVAADGKVFFGTSVENAVYALDAATGQIVWSRIVDGPVRLAPTSADGKIYFGSDDGCVYCLDAGDGNEVWRFRAAPGAERVLGNGRMMSLWPVRTGVLVEDGVAYFGAGLFPDRGLFLFAVDAATGAVLWKNDSFNVLPTDYLSPQGFLLASEDKLFVQSGRTVPAIFDKKTGRLDFIPYQHWRRLGMTGGTNSFLADGILFNGTEQVTAYSQKDGKTEFQMQGEKALFTGRLVLLSNAKGIVAYERKPFLPLAKEHGKASFAYMRELGDKNYFQDAVRKGSTQTYFKDRLFKGDEIAKELERRQAVVDEQEKKLRGYEERINSTIAWRVAWGCAEADQAAGGTIFAGGQDRIEKITSMIKRRTEWGCTDAVIAVGETIFAGGKNRIAAYAAADGRELWSSELGGAVRGLAVADGKLFTSLDTGEILCFTRDKTGTPATVRADDGKTASAGEPEAKFVCEVLTRTGVGKGYVLLVECDEELAAAVAGAGEFDVYAVYRDKERVAAARRRFNARGLYGKAIFDHASDERLPYSDYFANLVFVSRKVADGVVSYDAADVLRLVKPVGGAVVLDVPDNAGKDGKRDGDAAINWADRADVPGVSLAGRHDGMVFLSRGVLPGSSDWTHQYAEPGNTACNYDALVKPPFDVLWFGEPGPKNMIDRHAAAAAPLVVGGKMIVYGKKILMAYDAYNGVELWRHEMDYFGRTRIKAGQVGNLASDGKTVFVAGKRSCRRYDLATGRLIREYPLPSEVKTDAWEWTASGGGVLYCSVSGEELFSRRIFALDAETGAEKWNVEIARTRSNTLTLGGGKIYYVSEASDEERKELAVAEDASAGVDRRGKNVPPDIRTVRALDEKTGAELWKKPMDVTNCVRSIPGHRHDGDLTTMYRNGILLISGAPANGHFWKEFWAGEFSRRSMHALDAASGAELWSGHLGYRIRPVVVGDIVYAEPWAWDIKTGRQVLCDDPIAGEKTKWQMARMGHHCGGISASPGGLFFRSGSIAYYDLVTNSGTFHFGGQRPGCWVNIIPAGGLVVIPEASAGCVCAFPIACTTVWKPSGRSVAWGSYSNPSNLENFARLALNFGAPGDRKDDDGMVWIGYPRIIGDRSKLTVNPRYETKFYTGGDFFRRSVLTSEISSDRNWIFSSGALGLERIKIVTGAKGSPPATYTLKLGFVETENASAGKRVFDIVVNGKTVRENFDPFAAAGGLNVPVYQTFTDIASGGELVIELKTKAKPSRPDELPVLNCLELIRTGNPPSDRATKGK